MTETPDFNSSEPLKSSANSPRIWKKVAFALFTVALVLIGTAFWLPSPKVTTEPVNYVRNPDGSFSVDGEELPDSGLELAINAGKLKATNNFSSGSSLSHSGPGWFGSDSIMVINHSDHLLLQRASDSLVEGLKKDGRFQSVQYYPTGTAPEPGVRKPDLFLTLDVSSVEQSGMASSKIEADIEITLGNSVTRSNHTYWDNQSLPYVEFNANMRLVHKSTLQGVESSGARFQMQGQNIGERLAKEVSDKLDDIREKHKPLPVLPAPFHPKPEDVPEFQFLTKANAELVFSGHGPMLKNETTWRIADVESAETLLNMIHTELSSQGWKGSAPNEKSQYLRMSTDGRILTTYIERKAQGSRTLADPEQTQQKPTYWIKYQSLLTKSERTAAFENLLTAESGNASVLLAFKGMAEPEQYSRMIARMETDPPTSVVGWTTLASHYFNRQQPKKAVRALQCAHLLTRLKQGSNQPILSQIRKHKLKKEDVLKITSASLKAAGVVNLADVDETVEIKSGPETLAAIAGKNEKGGWDIVALEFGPKNQGLNGTVEHTFIRVSNGGSSWSSGTWFHTGRWEQLQNIGDQKILISTNQKKGTRYPQSVTFALMHEK